VKKEKIPVEYSEETTRNLLVLLSAFAQLLLDRDYVSESYLDRMMQATYARQPIQTTMLIPVICAGCGRKGTSRPGENTKCLYCGRELRFNLKDEQADVILASLDASNLFGCTVKAADLTDDETFISTAAKFFTPPCTYVQSNDDEYNFVEIDPCKVAENGIIIVAQNKVAAHQKHANLLCKIMFSIWELVFRKNPEAGSKLLKEFFIIDEAKRQHAYDALYAPATCARCRTEQWPASLFHAKCSVCTEQLPARLLPGLHVMQASVGNPLSQASAKERKLEYLYTLFEALFNCAGFAFGLTLDDLSKVLDEKILPADGAEDQIVCHSCVQRFSKSLLLQGRCPYCGESIRTAVPDPVS
jgi:hypothetical protein